MKLVTIFHLYANTGVRLCFIGRLLSCASEHSTVKTLLELVCESCTKTCHLLPVFSCLSEPIGPLIKIFGKHNGRILALATSVSAAGTIVISGSGDCSIRIYELDTGLW